MRIEICGGIASGKTTFSKLFENSAIHPIIENFGDNPFWKPFYLNPGKYIFETEITFTLQHYHYIKKVKEKEKFIICDFSSIIDLAYARMGLTGMKLKIFEDVYNEITSELGFPDLIVFLKCNSKIQLDRIIKRKRTTEKLIDIKFLESLNNEIEYLIENHLDNQKVITIDSEKEDFLNDEKVISRLKNKIINMTIR